MDRSTFNQLYKGIKERIDGKKYWENKEVKGELKEQWTKLRCGNIGKTRKKGFKSWKCAIRNTEDESLEHTYVDMQGSMVVVVVLWLWLRADARVR